MNKQELIDAVAAETVQTKSTVNAVLNALLDTIANQLEKGKAVQLVGFGTFKVGERAERKGRNPKTGEELTIPAAKVVKFSAGKALKDSIQ